MYRARFPLLKKGACHREHVHADEEGVVDVFPAFKVTSLGTYRPYVEEIDLKAGDEVTKMPVLICDGQLQGTDMSEKAIIPITGEIKGSGLLRIIGSSQDYEMEFEIGNDILQKYIEVMGRDEALTDETEEE